VLTDVPKHSLQRRPVTAEHTRNHLQQMLLPDHAKKEVPSKLLPTRSRNPGGGGAGGAKRRPADELAGDAAVGAMMPPRPMTALSSGGGFDVLAPDLQRRAATPLQQLQALQQTSKDVRENLDRHLLPRAVSTPPVPGPRAVSNDHAPSAMAGNMMDMRKRPKSSGVTYVSK